MTNSAPCSEFGSVALAERGGRMLWCYIFFLITLITENPDSWFFFWLHLNGANCHYIFPLHFPQVTCQSNSKCKTHRFLCGAGFFSEGGGWKSDQIPGVQSWNSKWTACTLKHNCIHSPTEIIAPSLSPLRAVNSVSDAVKADVPLHVFERVLLCLDQWKKQ